MENKIFLGLATLAGILIKELWDWNKSRHSKIEQKLDSLASDVSELKTVLLLTQSKYDLVHQQHEKAVDELYERVRKVESPRMPEIS